MTIKEKIEYLQNKHLGEQLKNRKEVEDIISSQQSMWCVCGRLATGFHESSCQKLRNKVNIETLNRLRYLINQDNAEKDGVTLIK